MSDTENKTENAAETKTTDTAPYLKKNIKSESKTETSKSNIVIPLVLLLVSAIVIVATFYEEEYSNFMAQADAQDTATTEAVAAAGTEAEVTSAQPAISVETAAEAVDTTEASELVLKKLWHRQKRHHR